MQETDIAQRVWRGWDILTLRSAELTAEVVPGKGGDIHRLSIADGRDLLWSTPWGLRERGAVSVAGSDAELYWESHPGGWQTILPNGGMPTMSSGAWWSQHGEAWATPMDWRIESGALVLSGRLVRSPLAIERRIRLDGGRLLLEEVIRNEGGEPVEAMWGQHPSFGPPLLGPGARIWTSASTIFEDPAVAGMPWPGQGDDLSTLPGPGSGQKRMVYLGDFPGERGLVRLENAAVGLCVEMDWSLSAWPFLWYWLEAGAHHGFPLFSAGYVLALEPFSSWPGGIDLVRETTGTQLLLGPGEALSGDLVLSVRSL